MELNRIDDVISSTNQVSETIDGGSLSQAGNRGQNTGITAQVVPDDLTDFEVILEGGINSANGIDFTEIGRWSPSTLDDLALLCWFPVSLNCTYKFTHVSGSRCKVKLVG